MLVRSVHVAVEQDKHRLSLRDAHALRAALTASCLRRDRGSAAWFVFAWLRVENPFR